MSVTALLFASMVVITVFTISSMHFVGEKVFGEYTSNPNGKVKRK